MNQEAYKFPDGKKRTDLIKFFAGLDKANKIQAILQHAQSEPGITVKLDDFDQAPMLLNCLNGTINLHSGELEPHQKENLCHKMCQVEYDPKAKSKLWESFLERILPNPEVRLYVQKALGYSIAGSCEEEKLFFAYGPSASGKSTLFRAIQEVLGEYAAGTDFETLLHRERVTGNPRNDIARLVGKRFVLAQEVDRGRKLDTGLIKTVTGGDRMTARFLFKEAFEFQPTFKLWLAANDRPKVREDDEAMWRRIIQIPFNVQIPKEERNPKLKESLRKEAKAILAWLVRGCVLWQKEGLQAPEAVIKATKDYREEMNPLKDFFDECCVLDEKLQISRKLLFEDYKNFSNTNYIKSPLSRNEFNKEMRKKFKEGRNSIERYWIGIGGNVDYQNDEQRDNKILDGLDKCLLEPVTKE